MVTIPASVYADPTLEAADRALEERAKLEPKRTYLGMSSIGHTCSRKLWYDVHRPIQESFSAETLKRFDDGHRSEAIMAARLRLVSGLELWGVDPDTGTQFEAADFDGRFKGHLDGVILGLLQAPKTPHVWEAKCVAEKGFAEFKKCKARHGEKSALQHWNPVYYAQAQCYMGYFDLTRHYLTVSTFGVRAWDSARTEFNIVAFTKLRDKAQRILESPYPLAKLSNNPSWYECKSCVYRDVCHGTSA